MFIFYQIGSTPLHWAVRKNSLDLTALLIQKGAHLDAAENENHINNNNRQ